ncbi:DUF3168 domain-containing protein [Chachezhania sediminis]|uniref:DUF3168 domain-containing protein n=1 Tax=Chachezhania sediminis TaxID=2599291 RepID=UPI00131DADCD|nr:DUF3168 domain-containing protein [Chachezhania sediminis]
MTYAISPALQRAVFQALSADAALTALVGTAIYDAVPSGGVPTTFVSLGPEEVEDRSDATGAGAAHRFTVSVVTTEAGFEAAKTVAAAICDALTDASLTLTRGRLVGLWFERAAASRDGSNANRRRVDLRFRARVEDDQPE